MDIERRELIELAQFVLNRSTEDVREELHEYLIEIALYNSEQGVQREEIKSLIEKEFGFSHFPMAILDFSLERLERKGKITKSGTPFLFFLSDARKNEIAERFQKQKLLSEYFVAIILTKIENKLGQLSENQKMKVVQSLFNFLGKTFNNLSLNCARLLTKAPSEIKDVVELLGATDILSDAFQSVEDKVLARVSIEVIRDVLREPDKQASLFLYSLAQSYVLLQIMNVDPECQALVKKLILSDIVVFLDTNIIIDLLCENARQTYHKTATVLIRFMNSLGIKSCISSRTIRELFRRLEISDAAFKQCGHTLESKKEKLAEFVEDTLLREYLLQQRQNPGLKWQGFIGRLRNFSSILKRRFSINIDNILYDHICSSSAFEELSKVIAEADSQKPKAVVEHDCFHIILVDHLREKIGDEGIIPKRWFVTKDKTLGLVENIRIMTEKKKPASVFIDVWLHMISPLLSPIVATEEASETFARFFSSYFIPSFPRMEPVTLTRLIGPYLDDKDLSTNELKELVGDAYLSEHMDELAQRGQLETYVNRKYIEIKERKHQEEIKKLQEEKLTLEEKLQKSDEEKVQLKREMKEGKQFGKYLAGAAVFFAVWLATYVWILLPTMREPYSASIIAIVISLIVGYLLGFKRYEWILEKFLERVRQKS